MPNTLTAGQVTALSTPGLHRVDHNLYVQIGRNGAKSWLYRFQLDGRSRAMGLGPVRLVPLTEAQKRCRRAQVLHLDGIDPIEARRVELDAARPEQSAPSFAECASRYIAAHKSGWSNVKHAWQWQRSLVQYAFPIIGELAVSNVTAQHLVDLLTPIWTTKCETAGRIRNRIERILSWAEASGFRSGINPAAWNGPLGHMLPNLTKVQQVKHHDALPYASVPLLYRSLEREDSVSAAALRFILLTACRSGEVRGMTWDELDLPGHTWTIPAVRMKMRKPHKAPLTDAMLKTLPAKGGNPEALVFPGASPGRPLSDMGLLKLVRKLCGEKSTVHGLRSSFRDWAAEKTSFPREIVELALAHQVGNEVERAYFRSDLFEKRRLLMTEWSAYTTGHTY